MEPLVLLPLWIWAALVRFPCSCSTQTHTQKSPNRPWSVCPLLLCCGASAEKQLHGNFKGDSSMHTTPNPSRHTEDALKQLVGLRWPQVCVVAHVCVPACVNKQPQGMVLWLSGHTACSQRSHSARGSLGGCRGRQQKDHCGSPKKRHHFFNIENTRLAPWSGMHAWFIYTLQMEGRLCVSLSIYICICTCACLYSHMWHQKSHP